MDAGVLWGHVLVPLLDEGFVAGLDFFHSFGVDDVHVDFFGGGLVLVGAGAFVVEPGAFGADHLETGAEGAEAEVDVGEVAEGEAGVEGADFLEEGAFDEHGVAGEEDVLAVGEAVIFGDVGGEIRQVVEAAGGERGDELILGKAIDVLAGSADDAEGFVKGGDLRDGAHVIGSEAHVVAEEED